jgi:hypothetical protein
VNPGQPIADRRRRFQIEGGARAWNEKSSEAGNCHSAAACSPSGPRFAGSGNDGAAEGAEVEDNWISAQIAQSPPADPSDLWIGASERERAASDWSAIAGGIPLVEPVADTARWTWPNDSTVWTASANSAKREPKRMRDRIQCMGLAAADLRVINSYTVSQVSEWRMSNLWRPYRAKWSESAEGYKPNTARPRPISPGCAAGLNPAGT